MQQIQIVVSPDGIFSLHKCGERKENNESPTRRIFVIIESLLIFVEGYGVFQALKIFYALLWGNLHTKHYIATQNSLVTSI